MGLFAALAVEPRDDVGEDLFVCVTEVGPPVDVVNGGGDIKAWQSGLLFSELAEEYSAAVQGAPRS